MERVACAAHYADIDAWESSECIQTIENWHLVDAVVVLLGDQRELK